MRIAPEPEGHTTGLDPESERRLIWKMTRSVRESDIYKHRRFGVKRRRTWSLFEFLIQCFGVLLKAVNRYQQGYRNATTIVVNRLNLQFDNLPPAFHGYRILHLSDLHLDFIPGYERIVRRSIEGLSCDLCLLTGDYRAAIRGSHKGVLEPMRSVVDAIRAGDGIFAILGNHDTYLLVKPLEKMGINVLVNETADVSRNGAGIQITGIDDPYYYYTDRALEAMEETTDGFKIAMVHTPAMYDAAAENGYSLYLCGHTHGGQICLPGGRPVVLHLSHGRKFYRGVWHYNGMTGYTSQGGGTVGIPVRFNTQSEVTLITLNGKHSR